MKYTTLVICGILLTLSSCSESAPENDVTIFSQSEIISEEETLVENSEITQNILDEEKEESLNIEEEEKGEEESSSNGVVVISEKTGEQDIVTGQDLLSIFILTNKQNTLIAEDIAFNEMTVDSYEDFGIPAEAVIAFNSYFEGGGYYYYGTSDEETLTVYRKYVQEPNEEEEEITEEEDINKNSEQDQENVDALSEKNIDTIENSEIQPDFVAELFEKILEIEL